MYLLRVILTSLILTVPLGGPYFEQYRTFYVCVCNMCVYIILLFGENLLYVIITGYKQPFDQGSIFFNNSWSQSRSFLSFLNI